MPAIRGNASRLFDIPNLQIQRDVPLAEHTRFGIGGPADLFADAPDEHTFIDAIRTAHAEEIPLEVIGGGSNLVVSDDGFRGFVLRYTANRIFADGLVVTADAGAVLQHLVDFTVDSGLAGIHTMTGIPGWVGAAVYGNAGAYGRSINQSITRVRFYDGTTIREFTNEQCNFRYRESTFKDNKGWIIFSTDLQFTAGDAQALRTGADEILAIRNAKYPPTMKCAGSIFKNLIFAELPEHVQREVPPKMIREGKVPSAYFLEQVGAKGMRNGDIKVADYHANLIYNEGQGTARQVREVVNDLKARVRDRFRFDVEEEVQYVGF
jgi:UDP-N-acetylmuramate dehydrogenase